MYVENIEKDFYDKLKASGRVLILANLDVDAICAVKILLGLFRSDHIAYTLVPVSGRSALISAFNVNVKEAKDSGSALRNVLLINCGVTVDLALDFDIDDDDDDLVVFVSDSHRPVDVTNAYNDKHIKLLMPVDEDDAIPAYDDVFNDEDSEEDEDDSEDEAKRTRFDEASILRRRERRLWDEKRQRILFEYQQFAYYGASTALLMFRLAHQMSKDSNEALWCAIVGHVEQRLLFKKAEDKLLLETDELRESVSRLNRHHDNADVNKLKVVFERDLALALYRRWTLYDSLRHSAYTAAKFKLHNIKGVQRLSEFLAESGLPLAQCKQNYETMDLSLRNDICRIVEAKADKYGLEDIVRLSHNYDDAFLKALDSLSKANVALLNEGFDMAKTHIEILTDQTNCYFGQSQNHVMPYGPYLYAEIPKNSAHAKHFGARPTELLTLAHRVLRTYQTSAKNAKSASLPLVLTAPFESTEEGVSLVVGVPPANDRSRKNLLGKAFEQALLKTQSRYRLDYFDSSIVQIRSEDVANFCDQLISLLS